MNVVPIPDGGRAVMICPRCGYPEPISERDGVEAIRQWLRTWDHRQQSGATERPFLQAVYLPIGWEREISRAVLRAAYGDEVVRR